MMMQWGCDLMDRLSMSGWIEASPEGDHHARSHGDAADSEQGISCTKDLAFMTTSRLCMRAW